MSKERTLKDSDINRQLLASSRRVKKLYQFFAVIIATAFISSAITLTISADPPASAPDTVIDWEGLEAYKVNGIFFAKDGTTDAISDALTDMGANGGLLIVPNGTFTFTSTLTLPNGNVAIIGSGATKIIKGVDNANGIFSIAGLSNVTIASMTLNGYPGASYMATAIWISGGSSYIICRDIIIDDWHGYPLGVTSSEHVRFENIHVSNAQDTSGTGEIDGVFISNGKDVIILNCILNGGISISGAATNAVTVRGCFITASPFSHGGVYINNGGRNTTIDGNYVYGFFHAGIECRGGNVTITNNVLAENTDGLQIFDYTSSEINVRDIFVSGNIIRGNTRYGMLIADDIGPSYPSRISITCNRIMGNGDAGIVCESQTIRNVLISSNYLRGNVGHQIYAISPDITLSENVIESFAGVAIRVNSNASVINNVIKNATATGATGIYVGQNAKDVVIHGNMIEGIYTGAAIRMYEGNYRWVISGNLITKMQSATGESYGIYVKQGYNGVISDNIISHVNGYAIYLSVASDGITISDNSISANERRGIYLTTATHCTIVGNSVCGNSRILANTYSGIVLANSNNCTVYGNIAINTAYATATQKYGLEATGTSDYMIVMANIFTPNVSGNYTLSGTHNIVYGNS